MVLPNGSTHYFNDDSSRLLQPADLVFCEKRRQKKKVKKKKTISRRKKSRNKTKNLGDEEDEEEEEEKEEQALPIEINEAFENAYHIGTVADTYHDSDSEFFDYDSEGQILEDDTEVLVAFGTTELKMGETWGGMRVNKGGSDLICSKVEDLTILDRRYFKVGDNCVKAKNTLGMCGKIVDMNVKATLFCPATKEYADGVDSNECQTLRRVYPEATVVYGNWIGIVETVTDVIRVGLLKDNGKKATKKKKTGKWLKPSWPLPAGDAFVKKEGDREDVENHAYLDEGLPDLLVEVKPSGQSDEYASDGEELSDEEEREFYYMNTLGLRHCDEDESSRVDRFHLASTQCGCYRPGDIVDVEEQKVARAVREVLARQDENEYIMGGALDGRDKVRLDRADFLEHCWMKGDEDDDEWVTLFSAFAVDNEPHYTEDNEEITSKQDEQYDAKMAVVCKKLVYQKHSMAQRAVVKSIHDGMAQVKWKMQHLYKEEGMVRNAREYKDDPLRRVAPKKLPCEEEEVVLEEEEDAPPDGNPEHFLPPWCEGSCKVQEKPPRYMPSSMLTVVDKFCAHFLQAGDHVLCDKNALKKYFPEAHKRALRFEEKREKLWVQEEKKEEEKQNFYKSSLTSNDEVYCARVISTETTCEVLWQDGSRTLEKAKDLLKMEHLEDHVYMCGDFVVKSSEFKKAVGSEKVQDLEQTWEDDLMRKREQYSEKTVLDTFAVGYVEATNSEERTADVVWIADAFVFEASENDNERFLANAEGKERPPHVMELKWREDWDDDDFSSEGNPPQVSIDDGGASYFDNHYNKYYANTMRKLLELKKRKTGENECTKRGVVRFKSRETVPVYALQSYPSVLFQASGNDVVLRNIPGIDQLLEENDQPDTMGIEDFMTVPNDNNKEVSASTGPKVLDSLVEQWGSTRFMHELKNHDIFNRDLAPPHALAACERILGSIHIDATKRDPVHFLCSAVKDVFVPFYERELQVIPGNPWSVPKLEENVYWFRGSFKTPKRLIATSPEWQQSHGEHVRVWGFAAAEAYKHRHAKHPRLNSTKLDEFGGHTYISSFVQDVSWVGEIVESSVGLMKIAWGSGTNTHQPPFNIELCELLDDSDDSDSDDGDSDDSMESGWETDENEDYYSELDQEEDDQPWGSFLTGRISETHSDNGFSDSELSSVPTMESGDEGEEEGEEGDMDLTIDDDSFDDEESDRVSGSEDLDLLDDENDTIERGAGSVAVFGSLLDGQLESIRRMVEDTAAKDFIWRGKIFGKDQDDIKKSSGSIDADSISRLVKNALPPGLFEEDTADAAVDDIMERYKKLSFSAHTELKKTLTRYSDEELKLLLISTHFWRRRRGAGFEEDDEVLGDNAEPSDLEKDFVSKAQLNAEHAARSRRYKDMAHPRNIAKAYPGIFLDADDARTTVSDVLRDSTIRSNMVGLNAFHSLVEANGPRNTSRDEMPSLLDSLNFVWRQERKEKVKQLENQFLCRSPRQTLSKVDDDATISDENNINDEDEEALSTSFDVVDGSFSDFLLRDSSSQMNLPRQVQKAVQKEWSILHKGLPANEIWVKSSQAKMNVLRAMIKGPSLTPYHDGLFCFDILFDENYPSVPPKVHYHSYGYRLNPNLYKEGKVCLSLLNTWDSEENSERWSSSSSALQVLVSLQALVLNDKPYYNEAGYEKQRGTEEGIRNSAMYSENAYLLNLKTMIQTIKRPPVGFEALVRAHFKSRRASILKSIAAYLEGAPVGSYCDDPNVQHTKHDTHNVKPTKGFLLSLQGLQETVRTAFRKI
ncbi:unnamed protein product [Bathycoccus prasinos]